MEKPSKLTTKKLIIILVSIFVVCGIALGAIVFAQNAVRKVASDETYTYVNPDETKAEADTGFKIDGVFDEEPYQKNNWLYLHREEGESVVDIASTSYYGDKGLYFAFEVTESTPIYVNLNRASYLNSCVELYFAPNGVKDMNTNDIFEVDMLPTGDLIFKQRNTKSGWTDVTTKKDTMAYLGATTKGGDVNTKDCYGYNLELFIPWDYLEWLGIDVDSMQKDFVHANMAHITSFNHEGTDINIDRYWYSFATQLGGNGFTDVEEYFKFDETGALGPVPITFVQGEHYTISGNKTVIPGLKACITVSPEEGYALNSILVNEAEWIKKVSYNEDGSVTFLIKGVKEGLTVSASAEPITQGNKTLSGTVYMNKITGDSLDGVSISYTGPQGEKPIELDANGRFTLNGLKQGYYTIFVEKQGYKKLVRNICLNRDIDTDLSLEYDLFDAEGSNAWDVDEQNGGVLWKKNRKSASILTKEQYNKFSLEANFRYDESWSKLSDDDLYTQQRSGLRIKFSNDKYWHVDILRNGDDYVVQYAKFTGDNSIFDWTQVYVLSQNDIAAYKSVEGIKLKIVRDGQYGNVYLGDKLIAIENLGKEFKNCTANLGFEFFVANQEFLETDFDISTKNIKIIKEGIFARAGSFDISKQLDGVVTLPNGGRGDLRFAKDYVNMDLTIWAKDDPKGKESEEQSPRTDVMFEFTDGKFISFSVLRASDEQVMVQSIGGDNSITGWKGWYNLSAEEIAQYTSEKGVAFRIVRLGTEFSVYIGNKLVAYHDFAGDIKADEKATVYLRHWGDEGVDLDIPIQVTEKIDLVNIVNVGNGKAKVVTNKKNHFVGDTVVLTGEGGYYCYKMKVDGKQVELNQDGTYSFVATKNSYEVEGTFAERIFADNSDWNTLAQRDGLVYLPNGGGANSPLQFYKEYADVDLRIIAKNDPNGTEKEEQSPRTDIQFVFEDGKFVSFGVLRVSDEQVMIQSIGGNNSITDWAGWYNLNEKERAQYNSTEGIEFRVVRLGTGFSLFIGDKMVRHVDLSGKIKENAKATVYLRHWGDKGVRLDFPFEITETVDKVAKIGDKYYNTLEAAVASAKDGDTVVLLKDVTVNVAMEVTKNITITNEKDVTITRGEALTTGGQTVNVPESGTLTILGAEGTTFVIDGASTEATSSRFAWVAGTLLLENVTVKNFLTTAEGAVVYNAGTVNFVESTITDNASTNSKKHGAVIWNDKGTVTSKNTTFTGNSAAGNGGVIGSSWNGGTITIDGGNFTDNEAASGGVICAWSPTTVTIKGNPTFSNNKATGTEGGGAIRTVGAAPLTINGGTFSENSAPNGNGGAIYLDSASAVAEITSGVKFIGNTAKNGGAIYNKGELTITEVAFTENTATGNGGAIWNEKGTVTLTDTNFNKNSCDGNGGAIAGSWSGGTITIDGGRFTENQAKSGGAICGWGPTTMTIEGATFSDNTATGDEGGGAIRTTANATLAINGGTFSGNSATHTSSRGGAIFNGGELTITEATFTENTAAQHGGAIWGAGNTTTTITDSTFSKNKATVHGGVIAAGYDENSGSITIDGGSFSKNEATDGGVIASWGADVTIKGNPTFENNKASGLGGVVRVVHASTDVNIEGATFKNNEAASGNAIAMNNGTIQNVTFEADEVSTNEILLMQNNVVLSGDVKSVAVSGDAIHITPNEYLTDVAIVSKKNADVTDDAFAAVIKKITIEPDENDAQWVVNAEGYLAKPVAGLASTGRGYASLGEAFAARNTTEDTITLYKDVTWDRCVEGNGTLTITNTADVKITRSSNLIASNTQMISYGGTLTIKGIEGTTITIDGNSTEATNSRMAWIGGTLTFENVEIKNFKSTVTGGIVYNAGTVNFISANVNNNSSTGIGAIVRNANAGVLNSTNSTFSNNISSSNGGVFASGEWSGGTINIDGGSFTGNKGAEGGVICGWASTITINGNPTFSNNQATSGSGGAIRMVGAAKLTINGGTFSGNSATNNAGGAIQSDNANAVINIASGVKFTGNKAKNGGAIFNKGQLTITGAEFTKNSTSEHGGVITNASSLVINEGTKFTENTSTGHGAVIFNDGSATTTINGGTFSGNTTTNHGGVIAAGWGNSGSITINGGTFSENKGNQGGVIATWGATVTIKGTPVFEKNEASGNGGAICRAAGSPVITIAGGTFKGNTAKTSGGAIYTKGTINTGACTFENNKVGTVGNDITITPNSYAIGTKVVSKAADTVTDTEFVAITKLIQVTPDGNGGRWLVDTTGCLAKATVTLSSNNKDYFTLGEAFAARNTKEDTITLHQNATWDRSVEGDGKLTITNTANVTITRSSDLIANNKQMISFGGTLTIKGKEGTTITIDGNSTEATNSRMAWIGGTFNCENVAIKNFKSTTNGTIVYNAKTVNFTNSTVSNNSGTKQAVVLYNAKAATATFTNSTISQNTCTGNEHGGAIWNEKGTVTLTNTNFSKNSTVGNGGAIGCSWSGGTTIINGGSFTENQAASGGALCVWSPSTVTIQNATFSKNQAKTGGAIYNMSTLGITGGQFSENSATNGHGGAICNVKGTITSTNTNFSSNSATNGNGGAIAGMWDGGTITLDGGNFTGNTAKEGGALCVWSPTVFKVSGNVTFKNNKATSGGGGALRLVNVTLTNNGEITYEGNTASDGKTNDIK